MLEIQICCSFLNSIQLTVKCYSRSSIHRIYAIQMSYCHFCVFSLFLIFYNLGRCLLLHGACAMSPFCSRATAIHGQRFNNELYVRYPDVPSVGHISCADDKRRRFANLPKKHNATAVFGVKKKIASHLCKLRWRRQGTVRGQVRIAHIPARKYQAWSR